MSWPWEIVERDHEIQNPLTVEKIRRLGEHLRLDERSRVLDVACGKGGPARVLAGTFGCRILGIELRPAFADEARRRADESGLAGLVTVETGDAASRALEAEAFDAALCLGAAFVWGHIGDAAAALRPAVRRGGGVAIGEPFWRRPALPDGASDQGFVALDATVARFETAGVALTGLIASSRDDWDAYESLHWRAVEEWLSEHPDDPDARAIRADHARFRDEYLRFGRELLGWAIFIGRTT
jgi:SAM-dependent methyltransferase